MQNHHVCVISTNTYWYLRSKTFPDLIKENHDLIRRFLRATKKSHEALGPNYAKALQLLVDIKKEIKPDLLKKQADSYYSRMKSPNNPGAEMLYNVPGDWEMTVEIMKKYRNLEGEIDAKDFYTNDFLPQVGGAQLSCSMSEKL